MGRSISLHHVGHDQLHNAGHDQTDSLTKKGSGSLGSSPQISLTSNSSSRSITPPLILTLPSDVTLLRIRSIPSDLESVRIKKYHPQALILTLSSDPNLLSNANQFVKAFSD